MKNIYYNFITSPTRLKLLFVVTSLLVLFSLESDARVGGGDSYGGGRRSGGGSSSGWGGSSRGYSSHGDGAIFELIFWLIRICFRYPAFGVPFLLFVAFVVYHYYKKTHSYDDYYSKYDTHATVKPINRTRDFVATLRAVDPLFSYPLFKDFVFSLYSHFHENRGQKRLDLLSQFFSEEIVYKYNKTENLVNVDGVVIGNCQIQNVTKTNDFLQVQIFFSANYTEYYKDGKSQRFILKETWRLRRDIKLKSKPPESVSAIACPNCGAPITETTAGKCYRCGESNKNGKFDWYVYELSSTKDFYAPANNSSGLLAASAVEEGTRLPTIRDPGVDRQVAEIFKDRKELEYTHKRIQDVFLNLQKAWTEQKWELARPFESDSLFQSHHFWIEDFKRKKEKNYIEKISIEKIVPVSIFNDNYYMSFTVRIYASMLDYTKNQNGKIIRGSATKKISFTEYWTFIKGIGVNHKDAKVKSIHNCPSCGAELKIAMTGKCDFCGSKITLGQFDWVLSQIEQDEEFNL
jgi:predicted RNA-binding Zn-ribbon protein involved in translation (DUF1610 family)